MSKHTPEPWFRDETSIGSSASDQLNSGYFTAECLGPDAAANALRIVACVNACAGMTDPAKEIAEMKRQRDELLAALESASAKMKKAHGDMFEQCLSNSVKNAWGNPVDVSSINDLQLEALIADKLISKAKGGAA